MGQSDLVFLSIAAQNGDQVAYNKLVADITPMIRNYIAKRINRKEVVDDLVQTVLLKLHRSLRTFKPNYPFRSWLYVIIRTRLADFYVRESASSFFINDDRTELMAKADATTEIRFKEALAELNDGQRMLLKEVFIDAESTQSLADKYGVDVRAMRVRTHRAVKALMGALKQEAA